MKILKILWLSAKQGYYAWAAAEIHPCHPDVGAIVLRRHELDEEMRRVFR